MGVKKNFAYSTILTCSGYVFSFITYPYVSRVLGVENIGICDFVTSIVQYFLLFATMGIASVGTREIAKCNGNHERLSQCFSSLFWINMVATLIVAFVYIICIFNVTKLYPYRKLMYIGLLQIVMTPFLVEWFFKGIENFKYITLRSLAVKIVYVVSVFLFVQEPEDYGVYFFLSCAMMVANAVFNWCYKSKFVTLKFRHIESRPYLKSFFVLGVYMLLTSMYTTFNTAYLGIVCGNTEVGYYSTAMKLQSIILAIYTAFTGVMIPRMSALIGQGNKSEAIRLIHKSFDFLVVFSIPLVMYTMIFAPQIIRILSGPGYENAVTPMRIVMPLIFIIGIEQILVLQILMPYKEDKAILVNSIIGALVGVAANFVVVPVFKASGSALVSLLSEFSVLLSACHFVYKRFERVMPFVLILKNILFLLPICLVMYVISVRLSPLVSVCCSAAALVSYCWFIQCYVLHDELCLSVMSKYGRK